MQGGLLKSASAVAIIAAAGLFGASPAKAADLGGDCCADLEERVAELEATTVRKGNRKVSLTISGFVAHQVMWWNDGTQKDMYIGDGGQLGSRFRLVGTAKVAPQITAGFLYEMQVNATGIQGMNQLNGGSMLGQTGAPASSTLPYVGCASNNFTSAANASASNSMGCPVLRDSTVWVRHAQLGMVKIGHGSTATDNLVLIDLGGAVAFTGTSPDISLNNGGFILRSKNGLLANSTTVNWGAAIRGHESFDTFRRSHVLYETPSLLGFTLQAAVANDNFWDIALRYAGEFHGVRLAAGIGYSEDTGFSIPFQNLSQAGTLCTGNCDLKAKTLTAAGSILHVDTGLFVTGSLGNRELTGNSGTVVSGPQAANTTYGGPDLRMWYITAGLSKNYFGIGRTVIYGDYSEHTGSLAQSAWLGAASITNVGTCQTDAAGVTSATNGVGCDSKVRVWGLGVQQTIDSAALTLFAAYHNFSLSSNAFSGNSVTLNSDSRGVGVNDYQQLLVGTRIEF